MMFLLAHDIGTSGTKTSVVKADGRILASETSPHKTSFFCNGYAEQNPEDWWTGICTNMRKLVEKYSDELKKIIAIGVSGHMLGCLPVGLDGKALRPSMIHSDSRASIQFGKIRSTIGKEEVYRVTGNILDPRSTLCKMLWYKENELELYLRTEKFLQSKDYIVACLTGNLDSTDFSDASHAQLLDINQKQYSDTILRELGLSKVKLPEVRKGTDIAGRLSSAAAKTLGLTEGIPVVVGAGDGACASLGAGVVSPGEVYGCLGTTAWISCVTEKPIIDPDSRIFNIIAADAESCGVYGTVQSAGRSIQWVMDMLQESNVKNFDKLAAGVEVGSSKLIFLPYLEGERSPIFDANARGVFFGISSAHKREHFMRATLEGISFALRSVLDVFRETLDIRCLRVIGGGTKSELWRSILANVCDTQIQCLNVSAEDGTSLGAALIAGTAVGMYPSLVEGVSRIKVEMNVAQEENEVGKYKRVYEVYKGLYPCMKASFEKLNKL